MKIKIKKTAPEPKAKPGKAKLAIENIVPTKTAIGGCTVLLTADGAGGAVLTVCSGVDRILACHVPAKKNTDAGKWNSIEYGEALQKALLRIRK